MEKCAVCGADTILYSSGVPLCVECDERLERQQREKRKRGISEMPSPAPDKSQPAERRMLVAEFAAAVRNYRRSVNELGRAVGGLELEAYQKLIEHCWRHRQICLEASRKVRQHTELKHPRIIMKNALVTSQHRAVADGRR